MANKIQIMSKIKSMYGVFNKDVFDGYWKEALDEKSIHNVVCKLQPLIHKEKYGIELTFEEACQYCSYFHKYLSMGGDPEYFISGAGAGDCIIS